MDLVTDTNILLRLANPSDLHFSATETVVQVIEIDAALKADLNELTPNLIYPNTTALLL